MKCLAQRAASPGLLQLLFKLGDLSLEVTDVSIGKLHGLLEAGDTPRIVVRRLEQLLNRCRQLLYLFDKLVVIQLPSPWIKVGEGQLNDNPLNGAIGSAASGSRVEGYPS